MALGTSRKREGRTFFYGTPEGVRVELAIIVDGRALCVGRVYDQVKAEVRVGLYWIYIKNQGARFGPFFADIVLAERAMKKILKRFGQTFFEQPLSWIRRQDCLKEWVDKNIGTSNDLIGGEWIKEAETEV